MRYPGLCLIVTSRVIPCQLVSQWLWGDVINGKWVRGGSKIPAMALKSANPSHYPAHSLPTHSLLRSLSQKYVLGWMVMQCWSLYCQTSEITCCPGNKWSLGVVACNKTHVPYCSAFGKPVSAIDILISTPGRLVDHITFTPGFDLSQLRFLVRFTTLALTYLDSCMCCMWQVKTKKNLIH